MACARMDRGPNASPPALPGWPLSHLQGSYATGPHLCQVHDAFADHAAVTGWFNIPLLLPAQLSWPMPAKIPWSAVDIPAWQQSSCLAPPATSSTTSTDYYRSFGLAYEQSLQGFVHPTQHGGLAPAARNRALHLHPHLRPAQPPRLRPSRQGEAVPASDFLGRTHHKWFTQVRRFQSLMHNLHRASESPSAVEYRLLTWSSIKQAKGFEPDFLGWWRSRPIQLCTTCTDFPSLLPNADLLQALFKDFEANFKSLESWNLRQRCSILKARRQEFLKEAFRDVHQRDKSVVSTITVQQDAMVLHVDPDEPLVLTDVDMIPQGILDWMLEDTPAQVTRIGPCQFRVASDLLLCPGQALQQRQVIAQPDQILVHFQKFWASRWNSTAPPRAAEWERIFNFIQAFVPPVVFHAPAITMHSWNLTNKRYNTGAARGPDGFDHLDLLMMPDAFKEELVSLLNLIERGKEWPQQLLKGFCLPLPKTPTATTVNQHRPIVIFPVAYRTWSSLRASSLIRKLGSILPEGIRGFLPGRGRATFGIGRKPSLNAPCSSPHLWLGA